MVPYKGPQLLMPLLALVLLLLLLVQVGWYQQPFTQPQGSSLLALLCQVLTALPNR
jgi:hypothetical protein